MSILYTGGVITSFSRDFTKYTNPNVFTVDNNLSEITTSNNIVNATYQVMNNVGDYNTEQKSILNIKTDLSGIFTSSGMNGFSIGLDDQISKFDFTQLFQVAIEIPAVYNGSITELQDIKIDANTTIRGQMIIGTNGSVSVNSSKPYFLKVGNDYTQVSSSNFTSEEITTIKDKINKYNVAGGIFKQLNIIIPSVSSTTGDVLDTYVSNYGYDPTRVNIKMQTTITFKISELFNSTDNMFKNTGGTETIESIPINIAIRHESDSDTTLISTDDISAELETLLTKKSLQDIIISAFSSSSLNSSNINLIKETLTSIDTKLDNINTYLNALNKEVTLVDNNKVITYTSY